VGDERASGVAPAVAPAEATPAEARPAPAAAAPPAADRPWLEGEAVLVNKAGLHAYPSHVVAYVANCFQNTEVQLCHGGRCADAKSVLQLLVLSREKPLLKGTRVTVRASGVNAKAAVEILPAVLGSGFGEER
jgi:phosphotransferase system HPr (HPr) family protein